jgi:uncharacterized protein YndB with AHSA1/START domain
MKNKTQIIAETGKQETFVSREFNAPKEVVFKAYSEKEILERWLGFEGSMARFEKFEPFAGGVYRYVVALPNGFEAWFRGVCHEHAKPNRIINTFEFEGLPEKGHAVLETTTFRELPNNRTEVTIHSVFQSVADRDGMVQSGMEKGMVESHENLEAILASLKID